ncbi:MAG: hypothetical protein HN932_12825 [Candidatus Marinimicrobia bacterium]|jgi:hypothetical protein|nr:hypothetical protein [Candidatus Neomarinimicrobiota bacterium]MBT7339097.1 hypothetical protein [Candidatus Jacksonbacteria bacterium]
MTEPSLFFKDINDIKALKNTARQLIESSNLLESAIKNNFETLEQDWGDFLADATQIHAMITPTAIMVKHKVFLSPPTKDELVPLGRQT